MTARNVPDRERHCRYRITAVILVVTMAPEDSAANRPAFTVAFITGHIDKSRAGRRLRRSRGRAAAAACGAGRLRCLPGTGHVPPAGLTRRPRRRQSALITLVA